MYKRRYHASEVLSPTDMLETGASENAKKETFGAVSAIRDTKNLPQGAYTRYNQVRYEEIGISPVWRQARMPPP
jgi:hypothetical protein